MKKYLIANLGYLFIMFVLLAAMLFSLLPNAANPAGAIERVQFLGKVFLGTNAGLLVIFSLVGNRLYLRDKAKAAILLVPMAIFISYAMVNWLYVYDQIVSFRQLHHVGGTASTWRGILNLFIVAGGFVLGTGNLIFAISRKRRKKAGGNTSSASVSSQTKTQTQQQVPGKKPGEKTASDIIAELANEVRIDAPADRKEDI